MNLYNYLGDKLGVEKYVQYIDSSGDDASTERLNIYVKAASGYILYEFGHCVDASANCDIWRLTYARRTDDEFSVIDSITVTGEWECAIKIDGRSDFCGGYIHGDEVLDNVTFFLDGKAVTAESLSDMTPFNSFWVVQKSDLYDPNNSTTVIAEHSSLHIFDGGLTIKQAVVFKGSYTLGTSYLAMFPVAKTNSGKYFTDQCFDYQDTTLPVSQDNAESVTLIGANVTSVFSILKKYGTAENAKGLAILDNSGNPYNKCYFITAKTGNTVSSGSTWKTEARYDIA